MFWIIVVFSSLLVLYGNQSLYSYDYNTLPDNKELWYYGLVYFYIYIYTTISLIIFYILFSIILYLINCYNKKEDNLIIDEENNYNTVTELHNMYNDL